MYDYCNLTVSLTVYVVEGIVIKLVLTSRVEIREIIVR